MSKRKYVPVNNQLVRPAVKMHYTITEIGTGPEAIKKWKAEQKVIEAKWQKEQEAPRAARRQEAINMVKGQYGSDKPMSKDEQRKFKALLASQRLQDSDARAKERLANIVGAEKSVKVDYQSYTPKPKPTFSQKIVNFLKKALFSK